MSDEEFVKPERPVPLEPPVVHPTGDEPAPEQAQNRILEPDDIRREPMAGANRGIAAQIAREKEEAGQQLSFVYPSKVWEYPWALTRHAAPEGELVLDAGCGVSALPIRLASLGATVVAIDNDLRWLTMLARAAEFHRAAVVPVEMDMTALKFPDATFDRVYCISVLEHIDPDAQPAVAREMNRVLKPGGILYLTVDYDEVERRSEDDVVYDRLALQRNAIAPSGLEIEGTTLYTSDDWDTLHHRMSEFKLHTFAAMAVALRKPPAEGPESADAIAKRRARIGDGFVRGVNLSFDGDLGKLQRRLDGVQELGLDAVRLRVREGAQAAQAAIDERGLKACWITEEMHPVAAPDGAWLIDLASGWDAEIGEGVTWSSAHAQLTEAARSAHASRSEVPVTASVQGLGPIVDGRCDGAGLDIYAAHGAGSLRAAAEISLVRDTVLATRPARDVDGCLAALGEAREMGYRSAFLFDEGNGGLDMLLAAEDRARLKG
ncbi:MAG: class I SAM-dependent methyltransferase [Sandaracinaceae bacterium]